MQKIIENFLEITKISRCSYKTQDMEAFLINFAKEHNFNIKVDSAKNILVYKKSPKICLQAHYDMVCVGDAPNIEVEIKDNIIKAKNSSLGADNGIAIAMMMELIKEGVDAEFLFTNDEEVGLIGAKNLELDIKSKYLLNLDSEDEAEVYIGCAGGADIVGEFKDNLIDGIGKTYEVSIKGLPGGHSGVDIDKNIPSAIKVLGEFLKSNNIKQLVAIYAGERRNSIPANAVAIIRSQNEIKESNLVKIRELKEKPKILKSSANIIELINSFPHGVIKFNKELNIPDISINLAQINSINKDSIEFIATTRAMDKEGLDSINKEAINILKKFNFSVNIEDEYPAWKPKLNPLVDIAKQAMLKEFGKCEIKAIHAGLECGVLSQKLPNTHFASIGPNIRYPHSIREYVDIESVYRTFRVVMDIIENVELRM
jgi:dipeptidase D